MHPELRAEQAHVDRAYERLAELDRRALALAEEERMGYSRTPAGMLERDVRERAGLRRRASLRLGSLDLCFGRLDRLDGQSFHLGRVAVADGDQQPLIVDWRAPVAEPFYRATAAEPLGVRRRRHLLTKGRRVLRLDDELLAGTALSEEGPEGDGSDLVLVGEAALFDALRRARTGRMGDIVSTIQAEQDQIIRAPLGGLVVVQGGPGTGKTAVALHRTAYLLYTHRFPLEQLGVLFVGPNTVFLRYIERVLPTLGESGCRMATIDDLVEGERATRTDTPAAVRLKGDIRMAELLVRAVRSRQRALRRSTAVPFGAYELTIGRRATVAIVELAQSAAGTHNARRPLVETLVLRHIGRRYERAVLRAQEAGLAARRLDDDGLDEALRSSPAIREVLDRIWPVLSPARLLDDLLGTPALLREAAAGVFDPDELPEVMSVLSRPRSAEETPSWSAADLPLLDELWPILGRTVRSRRRALTAHRQAKGGEEDLSAVVDRALADDLPECPRCISELTFTGNPDAEWTCEVCHLDWASAAVLSPAAAFQLQTLRERLLEAASSPAIVSDPDVRTYGHVVVDEAQDLSPMHWRMLARRCPSSSMTIVGDLGQASGHWAPSSWEEIIANVGSPRSTVVELTVNYRTPSEVMTLAARVLADARPDLTAARSVRDAGVSPHFVSVDGPDVVGPALMIAAQELRGTDGGKVAMIATAEVVERLRPHLSTDERFVAEGDGSVDGDDLLSAPVVALTLDECKGLEFDAVVVIDPSDIADEHAHGLGALYVALTRTTTRLAIVHRRALPPSLRP